MISKTQAVKLGAMGVAIPSAGMRAESFAWLRAGGVPIAALPITIVIYADGVRAINDGRHRIALARERGETHVRGEIIAYGPRGGERWHYRGRFPV